jgi:hypothetical protein
MEGGRVDRGEGEGVLSVSSVQLMDCGTIIPTPKTVLHVEIKDDYSKHLKSESYL